MREEENTGKNAKSEFLFTSFYEGNSGSLSPGIPDFFEVGLFSFDKAMCERANQRYNFFGD